MGRPSKSNLIAMLLASVVAHCANAAQIDIPGPAGSGAFGTYVTVLPNGNIVVIDPNFTPNVGAENVGAIYLYGPAGALISTLIGPGANDHVGNGGGTGPSHGNFFVRSFHFRLSGSPTD